MVRGHGGGGLGLDKMTLIVVSNLNDSMVLLWGICLYYKPKEMLGCTITGQNKAQLSILRSTGLVYWRTALRKLLVFVVSV